MGQEKGIARCEKDVYMVAIRPNALHWAGYIQNPFRDFFVNRMR